MVARLIRPDNGQPAELLDYRDGMVALDTTCISRARRWYTLQVVQACNPTVNVMALASPVLGCELPPPMVIFPMPQLYPQAVFLAAANYLAHIEVAKVDPVAAKKSAKQLVSAEKKLQAVMRRAVAQGQLPSERKAAA